MDRRARQWSGPALPLSSARWYGAEKEVPMIQLRDDQFQALDGVQQPPIAIDPRTGQEYLPIKREIYELVSGILKPCNRGWDPEDDLIRKDA
jgi:hypothetical protein